MRQILDIFRRTSGCRWHGRTWRALPQVIRRYIVFVSPSSEEEQSNTKCWYSTVSREGSDVGTLWWSHAWLLPHCARLLYSPSILQDCIRKFRGISPRRQGWTAGLLPVSWPPEILKALNPQESQHTYPSWWTPGYLLIVSAGHCGDLFAGPDHAAVTHQKGTVRLIRCSLLDTQCDQKDSGPSEGFPPVLSTVVRYCAVYSPAHLNPISLIPLCQATRVIVYRLSALGVSQFSWWLTHGILSGLSNFITICTIEYQLDYVKPTYGKRPYFTRVYMPLPPL